MAVATLRRAPRSDKTPDESPGPRLPKKGGDLRRLELYDESCDRDQEVEGRPDQADVQSDLNEVEEIRIGACHQRPLYGQGFDLPATELAPPHPILGLFRGAQGLVAGRFATAERHRWSGLAFVPWADH